MTEPIKLAEWISALRAELQEATVLQSGREAAARAEGVDLAVPPLRVKEIKLEVEITASREFGEKASAKAGIEFWIISGGAAGEVERRRSAQSTQMITLLLEPLSELKLGSDTERELLG